MRIKIRYEKELRERELISGKKYRVTMIMAEAKRTQLLSLTERKNATERNRERGLINEIGTQAAAEQIVHRAR